jgi:hypothetical protein
LDWDFRRTDEGGKVKRTMAILWSCLLAAWLVQAAPGQHTVTVTLNYDFTADNACSTAVTKGCLQQFNIYDLTSGTPVKLFSLPAPSGANGPVTGVTGTSGLLAIKAGVHIFGATAQMADGTESSPNASTATATVTPSSPASFSITVQ